MPHLQKISPLSAIIININVMLGAGLFINTAIVAQKAGFLGFIGYAISGLLMLPLIVCMAELMRIFPQKGFYGYAKEALGTPFGFISSWSYFTAKLASAGVTLHTAVLLLQKLFPCLTSYNPLSIDLIILTGFITLNMYNVKTGAFIQSFFMGAKLIPLFSVIIGGLWLFKGAHCNAANFSFEGIPSIMPLILYATIGFEAAVSLSASLENPEKNGPRIILTSYGIVIVLACLYQLFFYTSLGDSLGFITDFRMAFASFFENLLGINATSQSITSLVYCAIASSALGGCYGILFSNHWNLYTLAQNNHVIGSSFFTKLNQHGIPWLCIVAEGILCACYLLLSQGTLPLLQQISGLGTVIAYTMSVCSLWRTQRTKRIVRTPLFVIILGVGNCLIFINFCIRSLVKDHGSALGVFSLLLIGGIIMYRLTQFQRNECA